MKQKMTDNLNTSIQDVEIDFIGLIEIVWKKKKFIFFTIGIFFFIGIVVSSIQTSNIFIAETTFLIKSNGSGGNLGAAGSLSTIIGIDSPSSSESTFEISPSLYPILISSIDFKKQLISAPLMLNSSNKGITYSEYYEGVVKPTRIELLKNYLSGIPSNILEFFVSQKNEIQKEEVKINIMSLTSAEKGHFSRLDDQLKIESKDGIMNLSFSMPDPYLAAQMAQISFDLLQKEVIQYKLGNLQEELRLSESLYEEKKDSFEEIQRELGYFRDRNQNIIASPVQNQLERLQAEYNLRLNVVTQMANSLEATKIQIARNTPIFKVFDPVIIPNGPEPKNKFIHLVFFTVLGIILSVGFVFGSEFIKRFREKTVE